MRPGALTSLPRLGCGSPIERYTVTARLLSARHMGGRRASRGRERVDQRDALHVRRDCNERSEAEPVIGGISARAGKCL